MTLGEYNHQKCDLKQSSFKSKYQIKKCNETCHLPLNWARKLYFAFAKMDDNLEIGELHATIIDLETCERCLRMKGKHCDVMEYCEDKIKLLLYLSLHYQKIRTIIRRIYDSLFKSLVVEI